MKLYERSALPFGCAFKSDELCHCGRNVKNACGAEIDGREIFAVEQDRDRHVFRQIRAVRTAVSAMVGGYAGKITGGTWHYAVHVFVGEAEIKLGLKFTAKNLRGIVDYTVAI